MRKENGRLRPADNKETSNKAGKTFECNACGYTEAKRNTEFGEARCPKCLKGSMIEQIDPVS